MYSSHCLNQRLLVSNSKFSCWHRRLNGSAGPSLQAAIQLHMPASVLCSATDLFGLLGCSALHTASAILSPGSLMVQWPSRRIQNIQNSSQSTFLLGGKYEKKEKKKESFSTHSFLETLNWLSKCQNWHILTLKNVFRYTWNSCIVFSLSSFSLFFIWCKLNQINKEKKC